MQAWKHIRSVLLLPFMVTVVIPSVIICFGGTDTLGIWENAPATRIILPVIGAALIVLGLTLMLATIRLFVTIGKGTLAPWNPTQKLVVQGVYRHVRNPMISGVFFVLLGESVGSGSLPLLGWAAFFIAVNMIYMPLFEEPGLVKRFGEEYEEYRRNVPRWIPRVKRWESGEE
jgi:protein-S-isoprenylcysteine O-methyltransferase Ste14